MTEENKQQLLQRLILNDIQRVVGDHPMLSSILSVTVSQTIAKVFKEEELPPTSLKYELPDV